MNENIEITDEMLDHGCNCLGDCDECALVDIGQTKSHCMQAISKALKSERAARKNNPGVWDNAPEWATSTYRIWNSDDGRQKCSVTQYRELPKTLIQEIAEQVAYKHSIVPGTREQLERIARDAIKEYAERTAKK